MLNSVNSIRRLLVTTLLLAICILTFSLFFNWLSPRMPGNSALAAAATCAEGSDLLTKFHFDSSKTSSELRIPIVQISKEFPSDWTQFKSLTIEFRASSSQRMNLKVYTSPVGASSATFSRVLFHPYPKVWVRASIPLIMLSAPPKTGHDMAAVGNRSRPGYFLSLWGPFTELQEVSSIAFEMVNPVGSPSLEIRSVSLSREALTDQIIEAEPFVDEFGQFVHEEWAGKAKSLEDLKNKWELEDVSLKSGDFGYCKYGGFTDLKTDGTGFFRVEKIDGRWWFVDPDGHLFLSAGADVIRPAMVTRSVDRERFFKQRPPASLPSDYLRDGDPGVSFLTWNLFRRFGEDWREHWIEFTFKRMEAWGLNTIANWSDSELWGLSRKAYAIPLASWQTEVSYLGLPDIYSEEFLRLTDERARRQCQPRKDDPWLLGYFLANEPPFPQKELQTVDLILEGPDTATKAELKRWLEEEDSPERRKEFIGEAFNRYIQLTSAAVKKYDPNHLNLGMRGGGRPTEAEISGSKAFDVYSVNVYDYEVPSDRVKKISELTGKPVIIGEFHFGTPGRGLAASLVQVRDLRERGVAYRYYVEQAFSMPELIGTHWFQWADQPCTGRFDGENYNIGLVDVTDQPYRDLVNALKETHSRLARIHSGQLQPFAQKPKKN